jgi:hypothetical protein
VVSYRHGQNPRKEGRKVFDEVNAPNFAARLVQFGCPRKVTWRLLVWVRPAEPSAVVASLGKTVIFDSPLVQLVAY